MSTRALVVYFSKYFLDSDGYSFPLMEMFNSLTTANNSFLVAQAVLVIRKYAAVNTR